MNSVSSSANSAASSLNTLSSKISNFQMPAVPSPTPAPVPHVAGGL
jgi:hypothetical protein